MKYSILLFVLLVTAHLCKAQNPPLNHRLIASAIRTYTGTMPDLYDSSIYTYSGTRSCGVIDYSDGTTVNPNAKCDDRFNMRYNQQNASWRNNIKTINTYDSNDNQLTKLFLVWDTLSGSWGNSTYVICTYTSQNDTATCMTCYWNKGANKFDTVSKYTYTYDANGNRIQTLLENWISGTWKNYQKLVKQFNSSNLQTDMLQLIWNSSTNSWKNASYQTYIYSNGRLIEDVKQAWNGLANTWYNTQRATYSYTPTGLNDTLTNEKYDTSKAIWFGLSRTEFSYTSNNKVNVRGISSYDTTMKQWFVFQQSFYTYDTAGNNTDILNKTRKKGQPSWNNYSFVHMKYNKNNLVSEQSGQQWDTTSNSWNNAVWPIYSFYYLEDSNLSVHATVPAIISAIVYPNPCSKILNIDVEWPIPQAFICKMYNAMGHIVMQWNEQEYKSYHKTIQVGNLPADNYILTLTGGKGRIVEKVTLR